MTSALLLAGLGLLAPPADTTFVVSAGAQIIVEHRSGDIHVVGLEGREARVLADGESGQIDLRRDGDTYRITMARSRDDDADLLLEVPRDVRLTIHGFEGDIRVDAVRGSIEVETLEGDVEVEGAGAVSVNSTDGYVRLLDIRGPAAVHNGDGDTWIEGIDGSVAVESVDGDIIVLDADSRAVALSTIDGDVRYEGTVYSGGNYSLATHDGDLVFALPEGAGATVAVSTFDGSLLPSFPVRFRGGRNRTSGFTVGDGSARIELETFDGDIYLIRPGERFPANH